MPKIGCPEVGSWACRRFWPWSFSALGSIQNILTCFSRNWFHRHLCRQRNSLLLRPPPVQRQLPHQSPRQCLNLSQRRPRCPRSMLPPYQKWKTFPLRRASKRPWAKARQKAALVTPPPILQWAGFLGCSPWAPMRLVLWRPMMWQLAMLYQSPCRNETSMGCRQWRIWPEPSSSLCPYPS